jgi:hypothetical protein
LVSEADALSLDVTGFWYVSHRWQVCIVWTLARLILETPSERVRADGHRADPRASIDQVRQSRAS